MRKLAANELPLESAGTESGPRKLADSGRESPTTTPAAFTAQDRYAAAKCRHLHRDPYQTSDERKLYEARAKLTERVKAKNPLRMADMPRDDRRLRKHLDRLEHEKTAAEIEAWRACAECHPEANH